ncbi:MAG: RNA polymerase sigma factor [Melioribacteraceae bacterium]|nr:RNA polymerase sigma factor [Melioribacteraceae bacterium]
MTYLDFTLIYNKYKNYIYNYVLKMVGDKVVCDDIVRQTFLKLYENIELIRNKSVIKSWLFTTARNEVFTQFRKETPARSFFRIKIPKN